MPRSREKVLAPVRPNAGLEARYRRRLLAIVDEMQCSVIYWLRATYRANPPAIAMDAPAGALRQQLAELARRWQRRFNDAASRLADYFAEEMADRSDASLRSTLDRGGFSVKFKMTREMRDVLQATVNANVSLIKTIPQEYLSKVEGLVMRSVQTGRDLKSLTDGIERIGAVTRNRAALIARDQNNKATSALTRVRQIELGIGEAVWMHSHAGKEPRPTHVAMNGKRYDIEEGMWDEAEGRNVFPGELINCRCTSRPVIAGLRP